MTDQPDTETAEIKALLREWLPARFVLRQANPHEWISREEWIEGVTAALIGRADPADFVMPFPCQDTGPDAHPDHEWTGDWPTRLPGQREGEQRFRCPGWRGQS